MQLVFAIPGLLALRDASSSPVRAHALADLVAIAAPMRHGGDIGTALAAHYGIERQSDWPLAAIRVAALGIDPGDAYWLAADPVTLEVGRDDVRLVGVVDDLSRADSDALLATLNAHFAADGLSFAAPRTDAFFARVATRPALVTHPLAKASSRPLRQLLPEGADSGEWRRWMSEAQMLLHEHPVNVERERSGRPPANSLWFSCGGTLPPKTSRRSILTYANSGIAVALAAHAGATAQTLPASLAAAIAIAGSAESIVIAFEAPVDWDAVESSWAKPAREGLFGGTFEAVTLATEHAGVATSWQARRPDFWRRLKGRFGRRDLAATLAAVAEVD